MGNSPKGEYMLTRKNIVNMLGMGSLCLFLLGCSEESFLVQEESSTVILEEEVILSQKEDEKVNILLNNSMSEVETATEEAIENNNGLAKDSQGSNLPGSQSIEEKIAVHICGAVKQPGVYYLRENQRLYEGIQKAGGFQDDADRDYLNQALLLEDGMKIVVPTKDEIRQRIFSEADQAEEVHGITGNNVKQNSNPDIYIQSSGMTEKIALENGYLQKKDEAEKSGTIEQGGKIDLNTADEALLCTLPGIGASRAKSILTYREEHGPFQKPEDVMKVSGIKEAAYEKIKDYVIVSK